MKNVIFHIDEIDKFDKLFTNLRNLIIELENNNDNFKIAVLANGEAVLGYLKDENIKMLKSIKEVKFNACNNALKANDIDINLLTKEVNIVSAGVYYLTKMQSEGFAYIKV